MRNKYFLGCILIAFILSSCTSTSNESSDQNNSEIGPRITHLDPPASSGSGEPNLFTDAKGMAYLSWIEEGDGVSQLKFSALSDMEWSPPRLISQGSDWFVNWADFPAIAINEGNMAAHYLAKNGEGTFAYGVNMVFSSDKGSTWSEPVIPHETETRTEHGFVSLLPYQDGFFAAWLDGRNTAGGHGHDDAGSGGPMTLRCGVLSATGNLVQEYLLDDRTCDCCQTSAAMTTLGPVVAYRDRSEDEVRDIAIVRWNGTDWTAPSIVHNDNWLIPGCPVNGPVLAAKDSLVALAWFTSPDQEGKVKLAFSKDSGATFSSPIQIDLGNPIGRVDMVMDNDGSVYVVWMEATGEIGQIIVAGYSPKGEVLDQFVLADNRSDRASGFPRISRHKDGLIVAWRDTMGDPRIRSSYLQL